MKLKIDLKGEMKTKQFSPKLKSLTFWFNNYDRLDPRIHVKS